MTPSTTSSSLRRCASMLVASLLAVPALLVATGGSTALAIDVPPVFTQDDQHVTADALPTVQINGVVYDQFILGNTVYVGGEFTQARPYGSPLGVNETPPANLLAYNLTTGQLINSFVANTNGTVRSITASPDGSRLYIAGLFTNVNGVGRPRLAELNPVTGAVDPTWNARTNYIVYDIIATNDAVYAGGKFSGAGGTPGVERSNLAAFAISNGAVLPWAPTTDDRVWTMAMSPDGQRIFIGGMFKNVNGVARRGLAAVSTATGATGPEDWGGTIWATGPDGSFTDAKVANNALYVSGYTFGRTAGNLEGSAKINLSTNAVEWVDDCHGDTYQLQPINGYVYKATHAHFCGNLGGQVQSDDANTQWGDYMRSAMSLKDAVAGQLLREQWPYHNMEGLPAPSRTAWAPDWQTGTYTGLNQSAWSVTANSQYVVYGGEFVEVNSTNQQGLTRFAIRSLAPNDQGPRDTEDEFTLKVTSPASGKARITFRANFDRDDRALTYQLFRNNSVVQTKVVDSTFWDRTTVAFFETGLTPGSNVEYRVRVVDSTGNATTSPTYPITISGAANSTRYSDAVLADGPIVYWRLGDQPAATVAENQSGQGDGVANAMTFGRPGAIVGDPDTAATPGTTASRITQPGQLSMYGDIERNPTRAEFTVEAWFNTTSTQGGRVLGFGSSNSGNSNSSSADRVLYISNDGRVMFGVRTRPEGTGVSSTRVNRTIESAPGLNNGQWHHAVATLSGTGMRLYVDGQLVATRTDTNSGHNYYGYWRVGVDTLNGWNRQPTSTRLDGDIDEAAVYYKALTAEQIQAHWILSGRGGGAVPTASFTTDTEFLELDVDGSESFDLDGTIASYAWDFGDGGTATGVTASHTYGAGGTYNVTLTVTDDSGSTDVETIPVTVAPEPPNVPPVAEFSSTTTNLVADVNGSASSDADGSIVSYAWDFGDGGTATGVTASHPYAAAGTYTVTLTVTDNDGDTHSVGHDVTVTAPTGPVTYASDAFGRTVAGSWGAADVGGTWVTSTPVSDYNTNGSAGTLTHAASKTRRATLNSSSMSATDASAQVDFSYNGAPTGTGGVYTSIQLRVQGTVFYAARVRATPTATTIQLGRSSTGVITNLTTVTVPGLVYTPGSVWRLRFEAEGTSPTQLRAKVWNAASAEPAAWQVTTTDSTAGLQQAGGVGLEGYLASASSTPTLTSFDNLLVKGFGVEPPNVPPVAAFTATPSDLTVGVDASASSDSDGTITSYAWAFGDGGTATGVTASHPYAAAGTYLVTLTVTDNDGDTHSTSQNVTVTAPAGPVVIARDTFGRSVAGSWGAAETGGSWVTTTPIADYNVNGSAGTLTHAPGKTRRATLAANATDASGVVDISYNGTPNGGGAYTSLQLRVSGTTYYSARLRVMPGSTTLSIARSVNGTFTNITTVTVPGLVVNGGDVLRLRFEVEGTSPTQLRAKVWNAASAEPAGWTVTTTDATAELQQAGGVGLESYLAASSTTPTVTSFDELTVQSLDD